MSMDLSVFHNLPISFKQCSFFVVNFQNQHGGTTFGTTERVVSERKQKGLPPVLNGTQKTLLFRRNTFTKLLFLFMMLCIYPIVAEHLEMFFGDVDNKFFYEVQSRDGFGNGPVIFVSGVMKGYVFAVVIINTGCSDDMSAEVSADVFNGDIGSAEIWLCADIKTFGMFFVHFIFDFTKSRTDTGRELFKQYLEKGIAEKAVIKVSDGTPWSDGAGSAF